MVKNWKKKDFLGLGRSDPYLQITATPYIDKNPVVIYKSEILNSTSNPQWKPFKLDVTATGGMDSPLLFEVWDDDKDNKPDFIGSFRSTLRELTFYKSNPKYYLLNKSKEGTFYKNSGILVLKQADPVLIPKDVYEHGQESNSNNLSSPNSQQQTHPISPSTTNYPSPIPPSTTNYPSPIPPPQPYPQQPYPQQPYPQQPYPQQTYPQQPYPQQPYPQQPYPQQPYPQQPYPQPHIPPPPEKSFLPPPPEILPESKK